MIAKTLGGCLFILSFETPAVANNLKIGVHGLDFSNVTVSFFAIKPKNLTLKNE